MVLVYSLISSLKTHYQPTLQWSPDLSICVPLQSCSHFGALSLSNTLPSLLGTHLQSREACKGVVPCLRTQTSKKCPNFERGET